VKPAELRALLEECYRDKLALWRRHVAAARLIDSYEINNAYQYVIAREETQLRWLRDAVAAAGGAAGESPELDVGSDRRGPDGQRAILTEDAAAARAFVDKWRERVAAITDARNRRMCDVILGETREHLRIFEQAIAGRDDLLGRRHANVGTGGGVLPTRWVE
jgi:hypothetical protein